MKNKPYEALATLTLGLAGTLLVSCSFNFFKSGAAMVGFIGGAGMLAGSYGTYRKEQLTVDDFSTGFHTLVTNANYIGVEIKPRVQKLIEVESLNPALKTIGQKLLDMSADPSWVDEFLKASFIVAGVKNSGKTVFCHWVAARFLEKNPSGTLRIHDHNYGKRGNNWFNLPAATPDKKMTGHEFIFMSESSFFDLIDDAHDEYLRRKSIVQNGGDHKFPPYLLLITELSNNLRRLESSKEAKAYQDKLLDLLFESHGYGVFFAGESQSLAVGTMKLSEAQQTQLNQLLLGVAAENSTEVARIAKGSDANELIARVKNLRATPGGKYAAIANIDGLGVGVHVIPAIDLSAIEIKVPDSAIPEEIRWCESLPWDVIAKSQAAITKLWEQFGEGKQSSDNPKYQAFKLRLEQEKQEVAA